MATLDKKPGVILDSFLTSLIQSANPISSPVKITQSIYVSICLPIFLYLSCHTLCCHLGQHSINLPLDCAPCLASFLPSLKTAAREVLRDAITPLLKTLHAFPSTPSKTQTPYRGVRLFLLAPSASGTWTFLWFLKLA